MGGGEEGLGRIGVDVKFLAVDKGAEFVVDPCWRLERWKAGCC